MQKQREYLANMLRDFYVNRIMDIHEYYGGNTLTEVWNETDIEYESKIKELNDVFNFVIEREEVIVPRIHFTIK